MTRRKILLLVALLAGVPALFLFWRFYWLRWTPDKLILSAETTYITEPLDEAGYPDYYAALNERMSQGVTPQNNAVVPLLQALGPSVLPSNIDRDEIFLLLRMKPLRRGGRYFEDWVSYGRRLPPEEIPNLRPEEEREQEGRLWLIDSEIGERPWRRDEFPHVADWLDAQQEYFDLMVAASKRPRFYAPLVRQGRPPLMWSNFVATVNTGRKAVMSLRTRAHRRIGEGDAAGAWEDLMACHRLARLFAQGPMALDRQVGMMLDAVVFDAEAAFLGMAEFDAGEWSRQRTAFEDLPPFPSLAEKNDTGERFALLDLICGTARYGVPAMNRAIYPDQEHATGQRSPFSYTVGPVDWNVPLRMVNDWMDREAAAGEIEDHTDRIAELSALGMEAQAAMASGQGVSQFARSVFSQQAANRQMGEVFIGMRYVPPFYQPRAEEVSHAARALVRVGLALAHYRAENGSYPERLAQLAPAYLDDVPADPYSDQPFRYRKTHDGYRLYSVGENRIDDGGKGRNNEDDGDDLLIEVPWKPTPKPNGPLKNGTGSERGA